MGVTGYDRIFYANVESIERSLKSIAESLATLAATATESTQAKE